MVLWAEATATAATLGDLGVTVGRWLDLERVARADAAALPLPDGSIRVAFSNMLGQLDDDALAATLSEVARVLEPGGARVASAMAEGFGDRLHFHPHAVAADAAGDADAAATYRRIDCGRHDFEAGRPHQRCHDLLDSAGLDGRSIHTLIGPDVLRLWDVGLRPFFPAVRAAQRSLESAGAWAAAKPVVLDALDALLRPILMSAVAAPPAGIRPMSLADFGRQLDWLTEHYDVADPDEFADRLTAGWSAGDRPPALLTFDDGTRDHLAVAAPGLESRGLRGLFFVLAGPSCDGAMPLTHALHWALGDEDRL